VPKKLSIGALSQQFAFAAHRLGDGGSLQDVAILATGVLLEFNRSSQQQCAPIS
jgi:hypothetical protein